MSLAWLWHASCSIARAMCFFLAIGTAPSVTAAAWAALEKELQLQLERGTPRPPERAVFPPHDAVWLATHHGCSCDLLETVDEPLPNVVHPNRATRRALVEVRQRCGPVRCYMSARGSARLAPQRVFMTLTELSSPRTGFPTNCLIELVETPLSNLS